MKKLLPAGLWLLALGLLPTPMPALAADRVPITTVSEEAKKLYLEARDLNEKLRVTDARDRFRLALAKDPGLALAHLGLTGTSATANEFFEALSSAVALSEKVSEAERMMILGFEAGVKAEPDIQKKQYSDLVALYPDDERARNLLGNYYFGAQDYQLAIEQYERAVEISRDFPPTYNQLGYAYRFIEHYPKAEQAFRKYIELIPDEPNPYDSYAEFLMKTGRFEESIRNYEKALEINPNFIQSYAGIANNQIFLGKGDDARLTAVRLIAAARTVGEKRQGLFWRAVSFLHEGRHDDAIKVVREMSTLAEQDNDLSTMSGDYTMTGNILLAASRPDEAIAMFRKGVDTLDRADVPKEVKAAGHRNLAYEEARAALDRNDITTAKAKTAEYRSLAEAHQVPFELMQAHELAGRTSLLEKQYDAALAELKTANQQNPQVLYLQALACEGKGAIPEAIKYSRSAAEYNGLNINYAYVRKPATEMLSRLATTR